MEGGGYSAESMSVIGRGRGGYSVVCMSLSGRVRGVWLQCGVDVCEWKWKGVVTVRCLFL